MQCVLTYFYVFWLHIFDNFNIAYFKTHIIPSKDGDDSTVKASLYFTNSEMTNSNPILLSIARVKEAKISTRDVVALSHLDIIAKFCDEESLEFRVCADLPALSYIVGTDGPTSNAPCSLCCVRRERETVNRSQVLSNEFSFYDSNHDAR